MHKSLSGKRCSDHVAFLIAFQQWLKARWHGEEAEMEFCERKSLNMQTMRMVRLLAQLFFLISIFEHLIFLFKTVFQTNKAFNI